MSGPVLARRRPVRTLAAVVAAVAVTLSLSLTGQALARGSQQHPHAVPPPPAQPTSDNQIQNIDQVRTAIKAYYGDTPTNQVDPVSIDDADVLLHTFDPDGAYAHQVERIAHQAKRYLRGQAHHQEPGKTKAIVLDVDDTTLNTYNYEIYSNFVYNPATNAAFVEAGVFPAVPGMVKLVRYATRHGFAVFYLTGRPESQRDGTVANLVSAGYPAPDADHLFLRNKDSGAPSYLPCDSAPPYCTTIGYKSMTRQHIESLGYDLVANFGDQFSDLTGGFAERTYKIPNPMYYLP